MDLAYSTTTLSFGGARADGAATSRSQTRTHICERIHTRLYKTRWRGFVGSCRRIVENRGKGFARRARIRNVWVGKEKGSLPTREMSASRRTKS